MLFNSKVEVVELYMINDNLSIYAKGFLNCKPKYTLFAKLVNSVRITQWGYLSEIVFMMQLQ